MDPYDPKSPESHRQLARALLDLLAELGFTHDASARAREKVYRKSAGEQLDVLVYTTIEGNACRGRGADAIRVCLMYVGEQPRACGSERRVNRVGTIATICQRVRERISAIADTVKRCPSCGAPTFRSKSERDVCAAICWERGRGSSEPKPEPKPEPARGAERLRAVVPAPAATSASRHSTGRRRFAVGQGEPW